MTTVIASACFALFFTLNNLHVSFKVNFKPFSCTPCLTFWTASLLLVLPDMVSDYVAITFGAGVCAMIMRQLMLKLL
jgi:hypothetical protein